MNRMDTQVDTMNERIIDVNLDTMSQIRQYSPCTFPKTSNSTDTKGSQQRGSSAAIPFKASIKFYVVLCPQFCFVVEILKRQTECIQRHGICCNFEQRPAVDWTFCLFTNDVSPFVTTHLADWFLLHDGISRCASPNRSPHHVDIDSSIRLIKSRSIGRSFGGPSWIISTRNEEILP